MRTARIKVEGPGYYHCISRVVDRRMILGDTEKRKFISLMRLTAEFCGVEILTYVLMSNHFHILVRVPEPAEVDDRELVRRMRLLYPKVRVGQYEETLRKARAAGQTEEAERLRGEFLYRMYDVSEFMKTLKQRFSMWYNGRTGRKGTLWEERFKSVLVEGDGRALAVVAAYIDLNPVRAGLVKDPKDYGACGYGEAVAGVKVARKGLERVLGAMSRVEAGHWGQMNHRYRRLLFETGLKDAKRPRKAGFTVEQLQEVLDQNGRLPLTDVLRCRVRYFTDGAVLGSKAFVEEVFEQMRGQLGPRRKTGARAMKWGEWDGLCTLRALRLEVVTPRAETGAG